MVCACLARSPCTYPYEKSQPHIQNFLGLQKKLDIFYRPFFLSCFLTKSMAFILESRDKSLTACSGLRISCALNDSLEEFCTLPYRWPNLMICLGGRSVLDE